MPTLPVKPATRQMLKEQAIIWALFGGTSLLFYLTGADTALARHLYHHPFTETGDNWAWFLRKYASIPAITLAVLGLGAIFWPRLWQTRPLLYKAALVMSLTAILGLGFTNQILVKNLADRPRPRESVLMDQPLATYTDSFRGNSMPSGHAGVGFLLAAPFFPLRRTRPRTAAAFLIAGISLGSVVGISRMILGAHFASDALIAAALILAPASLLTYLSERYQRFSHTVLALIVLLMGAAVILGNRFTGQTFTLEITQPFSKINLPCPVETLPTPGQKIPTLAVKLNGYGAPLSNLKLVQENNEIHLKTNRGIYHHLTCTATLAMPETE